MTTPDNGMEEVLRRALTEAVSQVEPGSDALERIRARIGQRPPRPWLVSFAADVLSRARHWTWRGHWAWQLSLAWPATIPAPSALPWPHLRRLSQPGAAQPVASRPDVARPGAAPRSGPARPRRFLRLDDVNWLRPVAVLAGIALIASVSFGVQPFRQAIIQASSTVLSGGQPSNGGAGTEGNGTPTGDGTGSSGPSKTSGSNHVVVPGRGGTTSSNAASPSPAPSANCQPSLMRYWTSDLVHMTSAKAAAGTVTSPAPETAADLMPSTSPSPSPTPSCAAATPNASPTPSPTVSATPTPTTSSPTPTATPTDTGTGTGSPTATPTDSGSPTATPTDSGTGTGTGSPSATPTDSGDETGDGGPPDTGTPSDTPSPTSS
jgi:hypothetical protein